MQKVQTLRIIRGLPGSGKSTYAQENYPLSPIYEADMFFGEKYNWNPSYIGSAHNWCYYNVLKSLYVGADCVVANTFVTNKELDRYLELQNIIPDLNIEIIEMRTQYKSVHNVPKEVIERMQRRWVESPEGYNLTIIE
jgi:predicted kinase